MIVVLMTAFILGGITITTFGVLAAIAPDEDSLTSPDPRL